MSLKCGKNIDIFLLKKNVISSCIAKTTHIFAEKNINVSENISATTVKEYIINELVKLTMV